MMRRPHRDRGYAMVAVVASIAAMATIAVTMARTTAGNLDTFAAEASHARMTAAADAGIAIAIAGLTHADPAANWPIDGTVHSEHFADATIDIRIEDEQGKIALNRLDGAAAQRLVDALELSGEAAETARDSLEDWVDDDNDPRDHGAEQDWYRPRGIAVRNGPMQSVEELAEVRGFPPQLVARLAPVATVDTGTAAFDPRNASPLAIRVMDPDGDMSVEAVQRERDRDNARPALDFTQNARPGTAPKTRTITIIATAHGPGPTAATRRVLVVLNRGGRFPHAVRWGQ